MNYLSSNLPYVFFGILPSIIWLQFYLRKDAQPEPKLMILKIFFYGLLATIPAIFLEIAIFDGIEKMNLPHLMALILEVFLGVALIEEFLKFLVVREKVLNDPEFDEPVDAMIYMIVAALGFAAGENFLVLFPLRAGVLETLIDISVLRFLGATFLHALCSAIIGFFIGLSFFEKEKRRKLITMGSVIAVFLHGLYNFSIIEIEGILRLLIPFIILVMSAIFVSFGFSHLKRLNEKHKIAEM